MKHNEVVDNILARRSIRSFTEDPVSHEDLETIVTCGQWSPTGMNRQETCFIILQDMQEIQKLAKLMADAMGRDGYDMYRPPALIIVGHQKNWHLSKEDDACALQSMMLACTSLGLGSVWINQMQHEIADGSCNTCDCAQVREKLTQYGLPKDYIIHGMLAIGHPATPGKDLERKSQVIWV